MANLLYSQHTHVGPRHAQHQHIDDEGRIGLPQHTCGSSEWSITLQQEGRSTSCPRSQWGREAPEGQISAAHRMAA